jgi:hypothetical protein
MIAEFGFDIDIYLVNPKNESKKYTMQELLPDAFIPEMSIAVEKLPHRCRDGFQKNVSNFTVATVLDQKYWY